MGLKAQGAYLSRTLSHKGAEFDVTNVQLPARAKRAYDRAAEWWKLLYRVFQAADAAAGGKVVSWAQFW